MDDDEARWESPPSYDWGDLDLETLCCGWCRSLPCTCDFFGKDYNYS